jgi:TetR/AcrR family transcriptional regulator, transcriptional repressor for nem operon
MASEAPYISQMGRPRQFDEEVALDIATDCFWRFGFEGASTRLLAERMGLTAASLYNAFGDKRSLYGRALDRYAAQALAWCVTTLETGEPLDAIRWFFESLARTAIDDAQRRGCLVVNSGLETAPHDPDFRAVVVAVFDRLESLFRTVIERGQASGSISTAQSSRDLARLLLGAMLGVRVLARTNPDAELLHGIARSAVGALEPPARRRDVDAAT